MGSPYGDAHRPNSAARTAPLSAGDHSHFLIYDENFVRRHGDEQPQTHASCVAEPRWEHERFRLGPPINWPVVGMEEGFDFTEADDRYAEINPYDQPGAKTGRTVHSMVG